MYLFTRALRLGPSRLGESMAWSVRMTEKVNQMTMARSEIVFVVEEAPEGGFVARALGESIVTEADDLQGLREMVRDAVVCHFDDSERPTIVRLHHVHDELLAV